jgi:hypothetical protein
MGSSASGIHEMLMIYGTEASASPIEFVLTYSNRQRRPKGGDGTVTVTVMRLYVTVTVT